MNLPSIGSLSQMIATAGLGQSEVKSQELILGLPYGCRDPRGRASLCCFPSPLSGNLIGRGTGSEVDLNMLHHCAAPSRSLYSASVYLSFPLKTSLWS